MNIVKILSSVFKNQVIVADDLLPFKDVIKGTVFVIPNKAGHINNFFLKSCELYHREFCRMNDIKIADTDYLIEVWMSGLKLPNGKREYMSDNFSAHGLAITHENGLKSGWNLLLNYIPYEHLKDKKEGDIVSFEASMRLRYVELPELPELPRLYFKRLDVQQTFSFELIANQSKYRYSSFGPFENAVQYVLPK
jgi:hypothetical protein